MERKNFIGVSARKRNCDVSMNTLKNFGIREKDRKKGKNRKKKGTRRLWEKKAKERKTKTKTGLENKGRKKEAKKVFSLNIQYNQKSKPKIWKK